MTAYDLLDYSEPQGENQERPKCTVPEPPLGKGIDSIMQSQMAQTNNPCAICRSKNNPWRQQVLAGGKFLAKTQSQETSPFGTKGNSVPKSDKDLECACTGMTQFKCIIYLN